jgi:hypothetical protein
MRTYAAEWAVAGVVREGMEGAAKLDVPLLVNMVYQTNNHRVHRLAWWLFVSRVLGLEPVYPGRPQRHPSGPQRNLRSALITKRCFCRQYLLNLQR